LPELSSDAGGGD